MPGAVRPCRHQVMLPEAWTSCCASALLGATRCILLLLEQCLGLAIPASIVLRLANCHTLAFFKSRDSVTFDILALNILLVSILDPIFF
jgi:hypothetical protein